MDDLQTKLIAEIKAFRAARLLLCQLVAHKAILEKSRITTKEAAILLGVKPRTVRKYNEQEKLIGWKYTKTGMLYFFTRDVLAFQEKHLLNALYFD